MENSETNRSAIPPPSILEAGGTASSEFFDVANLGFNSCRPENERRLAVCWAVMLDGSVGQRNPWQGLVQQEFIMRIVVEPFVAMRFNILS